MKYYELTYLISLDLLEEDVKNLREKIISFIQEAGGLLIEDSNLGKKRTAYLKGKEKAGLLFSVSFEMNPEQLPGFEKKMKLENQILRYSILVKKQPRVSFEKSKERKVQPKVEMADIEKKLEEILGKNEFK